MHRDEDVKSEGSTNPLKDSIFAIISIFQSIKCSEDVVDAAKSKVGDNISLLNIGLVTFLLFIIIPTKIRKKEK